LRTDNAIESRLAVAAESKRGISADRTTLFALFFGRWENKLQELQQRYHDYNNNNNSWPCGGALLAAQKQDKRPMPRIPPGLDFGRCL